ncbi:MAG TPA: hypothetical protein DHV15_04495 [Treponema sp.]|uniref:Uncharacterized protein n=1 Tax=Treponema denticola (strain ATCC 35405 / DSM 14222 / CIP 103919 / JCM 8153 / KCTC 15104) TaxID=243275 RepID=Q73KL6_TREDE|nr:hypothetical protein TDE_2201 [Treponema denticola ATCC 35405]MCL6349550.1 hypothetical protein [Pectobacterium carotovorum subsp. carotovorum]HCY94759.1 hypothetical protein [Treponema sp.]
MKSSMSVIVKFYLLNSLFYLFFLLSVVFNFFDFYACVNKINAL